MATFTRLKSGSWRVQVRRKRTYVNNALLRRKDTEEWAGDVAKTVVALNRTGGPFAH